MNLQGRILDRVAVQCGQFGDEIGRIVYEDHSISLGGTSPKRLPEERASVKHTVIATLALRSWPCATCPRPDGHCNEPRENEMTEDFAAADAVYQPARLSTGWLVSISSGYARPIPWWSTQRRQSP